MHQQCGNIFFYIINTIYLEIRSFYNINLEEVFTSSMWEFFIFLHHQCTIYLEILLMISPPPTNDQSSFSMLTCVNTTKTYKQAEEKNSNNKL